jgi:hypothetical protein
MNELVSTLDSLHDTDVVVAKLNKLVQASDQDAALRTNLEALAKRRRDLERRLGAQLRDDQLDLIEYRIEAASGEICPALAVARAIQHFQEMTTTVFDAVRASPKRTYQPSQENIELSTLHLAGARVGSVTMSLAIPNERLLAIQSDLDLTFELVFELLRLRNREGAVKLQRRTGIAALSRALAWAQNSVEHGLTTFVSWQKSEAVSESAAISPNEALILQTTIETTAIERIDDVEQECELVSLNGVSSSFVLRAANGEELAGRVGNGFPRGPWTIHEHYAAALTRRLSIRCSTGEETAQWTLNSLTPLV